MPPFVVLSAIISVVKTVNTRQLPLFECTWWVAPGYSWVEWLNQDGQPVRPSKFDLHPNTQSEFSQRKGGESGPILMAAEGPAKETHPMDRMHATLFREFAELEPMSLEGIQAFAREHGWLGLPNRPFQSVRLPDGTFHHAGGEPHLYWVTEIAQMRQAIYLCDNPKRWKGEEKYLEWLFASHLQRVQGRLRFPVKGPPNLRVEPMTLLAAMWLQLAMAVAGKKDFIKCKQCDQQIEISTAESGFRTNRQFCSASCKTNDYRQRKRTALRLARDGRATAAIARQVATDRETVRRWLDGLPQPSGKPLLRRKR